MAFSVLKAIWAGFLGDARARARSADLVILPPNVLGTNCANCEWIAKPVRRHDGVLEGDCIHPLVKLRVTSRECCLYWTAPGAVRVADLPVEPPGLQEPSGR